MLVYWKFVGEDSWNLHLKGKGRKQYQADWEVELQCSNNTAQSIQQGILRLGLSHRVVLSQGNGDRPLCPCIGHSLPAVCLEKEV